VEEIWKDVAGYEGLYEVSNLGNVRSVARTEHVVQGNKEFDRTRNGRAMVPDVSKYGYARVSLCKNGAMKHYLVHRLVAQAFLPNPDDLPQVNHRNEDKGDNRVDNLEWCTCLYNVNFGTGIQRRADTQKQGKRCKKVYQFTLDGKLVAEYPSLRGMQRATGFDYPNIREQIAGKYKHAYGYLWSYSNDIAQ
jgi:hypothetical protein